MKDDNDWVSEDEKEFVLMEWFLIESKFRWEFKDFGAKNE